MAVISIVSASDGLTIATYVLAGITLALVAATISLVLSTRAGTARAQEAAQAELKLLERQVGSTYRPRLVDVLSRGPVLDYMGAEFDVETGQGPNATIRHPGPTIEARFGNAMEPERFDPRTVFGKLDGGRVFLSAPLRNVGRELAVIDGGSVELEGPGLLAAEYRTIQRYHVPVNESTRVDLIVRLTPQADIPLGLAWFLLVPYADFAGEQRTVAKLQLVRRGEGESGPWLVERVDQESIVPPR
jgi:hypothetical protein